MVRTGDGGASAPRGRSRQPAPSPARCPHVNRATERESNRSPFEERPAPSTGRDVCLRGRPDRRFRRGHRGAQRAGLSVPATRALLRTARDEAGSPTAHSAPDRPRGSAGAGSPRDRACHPGPRDARHVRHARPPPGGAAAARIRGRPARPERSATPAAVAAERPAHALACLRAPRQRRHRPRRDVAARRPPHPDRRRRRSPGWPGIADRRGRGRSHALSPDRAERRERCPPRGDRDRHGRARDREREPPRGAHARALGRPNPPRELP